MTLTYRERLSYLEDMEYDERADRIRLEFEDGAVTYVAPTPVPVPDLSSYFEQAAQRYKESNQ